jgi:hypothetical protein
VRRGAIVFLVAVGVLAMVSGKRLDRGSSDPHFIAQANAWLHGHTDIDPWPRGADDPARVEIVELADGRIVRGRHLTTRPTFYVAAEGEIPADQVVRTVETKHYNSFPPVPSLLFLPQALLHGAKGNDVGTTILFAALAPLLLLLLLRRLRDAGHLERPEGDDYWLAALLSFGTVLFFSSVQGRVWFTAHVVGVDLALLYLLFAIDARRPFWAGLMLGLAAGTRAPMLFMAPLLVLEAWRVAPSRANFVKRVVAAAVPAIVVGALLAWYNFVRFGELGEFGHRYLAVRQQAQIERWGMFSLEYLWRNLRVAFAIFPELLSRAPWVRISGHGLAIWLTTPVFLLLLRPPVRFTRLQLHLWITVTCVAGWSLVYQNTGWVQFGYRFLLDYVVILVLLLALSGRRFGWPTRALILVGILVNLFGALTFGRAWQFYRTDGSAYEMREPLTPK